MNSHDCSLCRSSSSCCVSSCEDRMRSTSLRACVCSRLSPARLSACRRRSCSLLRSSLSSAVKVGRLVLRDSMGASKLDLWRIRFSTIRKSKHSKRRQTVNWTWEVVCWFSFRKSRQLRIRQDARAYGFVFERHQRSDIFVEKLYGMRARAFAVHALARARGAAPDDGWSCSLGHSEAAPQSGQMSCGR